MCFNATLTTPLEVAQRIYNLKIDSELGIEPLDKFNSAFVHPVFPIILNDRILDKAKWGLIPTWVADHKKAEDIIKYTLNARLETIDSKPSFKGSVNRGRCIVMFDGFYEWKHLDNRKIPYYVTREEQKPFLAAGLYSKWGGFNTFTLITTEAQGIMREIHNSKLRMPFFLNEDEMDIWLDSREPYNNVKERISLYYRDLIAVEREPVN